MLKRFIVAVLLAVLTAVPHPALAQGAGGSIAGMVGDPSGHPIAGATVTVSGSSSYATHTDNAGNYAFALVPPGTYTISFQQGGYETSNETVIVANGQALNVNVRLQLATLTSLKQIASVRSSRNGNFNTSTAAINTVDNQTFVDQGATSVTDVLNQIPGVQISLPGNDANGASPGAIRVDNVRNGLSFETATLIDGHPLSTGAYGDYVTTFLNPYLLGSVEVIKGPGAMAPEVNYAINGTINFRTKDPTPTVDPFYTIGATSRNGGIFAFGVSDTIDRLGFVVGVAGISDPSAIHNTPVYFDPSFGNPTFSQGTQVYGGCSLGTLPNLNPKQYISQAYNQCSLFAQTNISADYYNFSQLVKLRYKIGQSTYVTASYFGGQSTANQDGNLSELVPATFTPDATYTGPIKPGSTIYYLNDFYAGAPEYETNNEPIFQGEVSSAIGHDTILARYYHASIDRIQSDGFANPFNPNQLTTTLNGTLDDTPGSPFNNVTTTLPVYDYYNDAEEDKLFGYSLQYTHPFSDYNQLTFAVNATQSQSVDYDQYVDYNYNGASCPANENASFCLTTSTSLPTGTQQNFTTFLLRDQAQLTSKLAATVALYENAYKSTYPTNCENTTISATAQTVCEPTGYLVTTDSTSGTPVVSSTPVNFQTSTPTHFDPRFALEWRPHPNVAVRLAAGSSIAPPYLYILSRPNGAISYSPGAPYATQIVNAGNLRPETAFGYDLGSDYAFKDGATYASTDFFLTNLFGQFLESQYQDGLCPVGVGCPANTPLYKTSYTNLSSARYEGIELSLRHLPSSGFGFVIQGSTQRGYPYNLPPNFYCSFVVTKATPCNKSSYDTNLSVVSGQNFTGEYLNASGGLTQGVDNQSVPYLQGNVEINYRLKNGAFALFGDTLHGKNNSLNEPPFGIAYASLSYPINNDVRVQVSGSNIFNAWPGLFPTLGGGVAIPLANGQEGATLGNVVGPASYRFLLTKTFGSGPVNRRGNTSNGEPGGSK